MRKRLLVPLDEDTKYVGLLYDPLRCPATRPCENLWCKYHLAIDRVLIGGTIKLQYNFPETPLDKLEYTCAIEVANLGPQARTKIGEVINQAKTRIEQIEHLALYKLRRKLRGTELDESLLHLNFTKRVV